MPASELQATFDFTYADLEANRCGELSSDQQRYLARRLQDITRGLIVFLFGLALPPAGGLIIFGSQQNWPIVGLSLFLLVLLPMMGYWIASGERQKWQRDLEHGVAATVYGTANLPEGETRSRNRQLRIDTTTFTITPAQARAIRPGTIYTVYYGPRTTLILSLEEGSPA